jgi:hypothetical protein
MQDNEGKPPGTNNDEKVRWFLVGWITFLTTLIVVAFLITQSEVEIKAITFLGTGITFTFAYYFRLRRTKE